jgi:hypothetical protein
MDGPYFQVMMSLEEDLTRSEDEVFGSTPDEILAATALKDWGRFVASTTLGYTERT